jgi:hypothetical protein
MGAFRKQEDRRQGFLLPPSPADWLPEGHLAWFVIDAVSIGLYLSRDLFFTAALFDAYLVMIVIGYRSWRASMLEPAA